MPSKSMTRQIGRYGRESFLNAVSLLNDAIRLYKTGRWGTAFFLATISLEEVGKCIFANDAIFNIQVNDADLDTTIEWLKLSTNHRIKQLKFVRKTTPRLPAEFIKLVMDRKLEGTKQRSLYVDIELNKSRKLFSVTSPAAVGEAKARRQICLSHESICDIVQGSVDGNYIFEMGSDVAPLNRRTLARIRRMWKKSYKMKRSSYHEEIIREVRDSA